VPDTVHTVVVWLEKLTASPELAVALTLKSASPYVLFPRAPNVIVWVAAVMLNALLVAVVKAGLLLATRV
jgi:hypothetical protein